MAKWKYAERMNGKYAVYEEGMGDIFAPIRNVTLREAKDYAKKLNSGKYKVNILGKLKKIS